MSWGRGSTRAWRVVRASILSRDPVCQLRLRGICTWNSTEVDHLIRPDDGGTDDPANLRGLCSACHAEVTKQQAARGRARRRARASNTEPHPGVIQD